MTEWKRPENEPLYRLQAEMDFHYRAILSNKLENAEIPLSGNYTVSRYYGRYLGFLMALICDRMKKDVELTQEHADFPKNMRIAWNIFQVEKGDMMPWGGDAIKWEKMRGEMKTVELDAIEKIWNTIKQLPKEPIYNYKNLSLGSFEGMIIYMKHMQLSKLCEESDLFKDRQ